MTNRRSVVCAVRDPWVRVRMFSAAVFALAALLGPHWSAAQGSQFTIGVLPFADNTGAGQDISSPVSRALQTEIVRSTEMVGRVLTLDSGASPNNVDAQQAVTIGRSQGVDVVAAPAAEASPQANPAPAAQAAAASGAGAADNSAAIKVYQNYDFTPGDTILFSDDFTDTQDGEFPDRWELVSGQGVVNGTSGKPAFYLTDGNFARVAPRIKSKSYLGDQYTFEFDWYPVPNSAPILLFLKSADDEGSISFGKDALEFHGPGDHPYVNVYEPPGINNDSFFSSWHHVAFAVKGTQMKIYIDQFRIMTVPDMGMKPVSLQFGGIAGQDQPLVFSNVRLANGGGMNMIGQKFTDAKIVTHGINFDVDKATIRPESMGTLNQIKRILTQNPDLKFEIDGHTDNSGTAAHNLTLSQQRADAVKVELVSMGIDGSRLTTKGFGDTKPIADNSTPDGKANNRRVEFVRVP